MTAATQPETAAEGPARVEEDAVVAAATQDSEKQEPSAAEKPAAVEEPPRARAAVIVHNYLRVATHAAAAARCALRGTKAVAAAV